MFLRDQGVGGSNPLSPRPMFIRVSAITPLEPFAISYLDRGQRRGCERFFSRRFLSSNSRMIFRVSICICSRSCSSAPSAHISCHLSLVWCGAIRIPFKTRCSHGWDVTVFQYPTLLDSKPCLSNTEHSGGKLPMCGFCQRQSRRPSERHSKKPPRRADERYCSDRRLEHGILCSVRERRSGLMTPQRPNWHELAEQASKELDPVKLLSLVDELNRALEQNEQTSMRLQTQQFV